MCNCLKDGSNSSKRASRSTSMSYETCVSLSNFSFNFTFFIQIAIQKNFRLFLIHYFKLSFHCNMGFWDWGAFGLGGFLFGELLFGELLGGELMGGGLLEGSLCLPIIFIFAVLEISF